MFVVAKQHGNKAAMYIELIEDLRYLPQNDGGHSQIKTPCVRNITDQNLIIFLAFQVYTVYF